MPAAVDGKQLAIVSGFTLVFLLTTVLVAHPTRSGVAMAALMTSMCVVFVALGLVRAHVQHRNFTLLLEQPRGSRRAPNGRTRSSKSPDTGQP